MEDESKYFYIQTVPLPPKGERVALASDLHIGHGMSRYEAGWQFLKDEVAAGHYDTVVIGGDFTDRDPYSKGRPNPAHTQLLMSELRSLLALNARVKVRFIIGNHDRPFELQHAMELLHREMGDRFTVCDALRMGDALFTHGDFNNHVARSTAKMRLKRREHNNFSSPKPESYERDNIREIAKKVSNMLGDAYEDVSHVFFGHIHPDRPLTGATYDGKNFHITGCSFIDSPNSLLGITFDGSRVTDVKEIFSQPVEMDAAQKWRANVPAPSAGRRKFRSGGARSGAEPEAVSAAR